MYCERIGSGLWSEPFNAFTNFAFLIVAWAVWRLAKRLYKLDAETHALILTIVAIGVGSFLFHTFASTWAWWLDVIPILSFQMIYIWLYLRQIVHTRAVITIGVVALFMTLVLAAWAISDAFNGSLPYIPAAIALFSLGVYHFRQCVFDKMALLVAAGVFSLSIIFRSIDVITCEDSQNGTHFIWHLLNAVTLYLGARAYISNKQNRTPTY